MQEYNIQYDRKNELQQQLQLIHPTKKQNTNLLGKLLGLLLKIVNLISNLFNTSDKKMIDNINKQLQLVEDNLSKLKPHVDSSMALNSKLESINSEISDKEKMIHFLSDRLDQGKGRIKLLTNAPTVIPKIISQDINDNDINELPASLQNNTKLLLEKIKDMNQLAQELMNLNDTKTSCQFRMQFLKNDIDTAAIKMTNIQNDLERKILTQNLSGNSYNLFGAEPNGTVANL